MQKHIVLAGNPNVGKSTIFNQLTGSRQKIANYPGVTVERHVGYFTTPTGQKITVTDLPGTYSLNSQSEDEAIAARYIQGQVKDIQRPDVVLVVVEASKLRRGLLLAKQIKQKHPQVVLVLNMIDELSSYGMKIHVEKLSGLLHMPIVPLCAKKGKGMATLVHLIEQQNILSEQNNLPQESVESSFCVPEHCHGPHVWPWAEGLEEEFKHIDHMVSQVVTKSQIKKKHLTETLDRFFLHPLLGPLVFFGVMFFMFQALFSWSAPFMDVLEKSFQFLSKEAHAHITSPWLASLIADGVFAGVGSVLVFLPQIFIAFLLIGFFEMSGYLSRGAFLIDRLMRLFGLEGRSFIPLISSFACAVPGIMSTRTIPNERQRLITILIAPFMTCSARLPVYTLLIACFVPTTKIFGILSLQALTLFCLFLSGIVAAMIMALIMHWVLPHKEGGVFCLELPRYRLPTAKTLYHYIANRLFVFLKTAGTIIFICSVLLWGLAYFPQQANAKLSASQHLTQSYMGQLGHLIEPAIKPLGFDWKIGMGLVSSFAAREVFVSTMGIVNQIEDTKHTTLTLREKLQTETKPDGSRAYTMRMAFALMAFFAFAAQCLSTLAVIQRETKSWKWPALVFCYMTGFAYLMAFFVYQGLGFLGLS